MTTERYVSNPHEILGFRYIWQYVGMAIELRSNVFLSMESSSLSLLFHLHPHALCMRVHNYICRYLLVATALTILRLSWD